LNRSRDPEIKDNYMRLRQNGFSLIELLIVVAIILIIAAIAIPSLIRSKMAANEASAVESLRSINTAEVAYTTSYPTVGFSTLLADLGGSAAVCAGGPSVTSACLVDPIVAASDTTAKSGYLNTYGGVVASSGVNTSYTLNADPASRGTTGQRSFFTDQTCILRVDPSVVATAASSPL
jgi:type IV pilus assembly protein PilA